MAAMRVFGPDAFLWTIVQFRVGESESTLAEWANSTEIAEIANRGGTLRDMSPDHFIQQTFNLQTGGQAALSRCNLQAFHLRSWKTFVRELQLHVDTFGTAYVACNYVSPSDPPYKLGYTVRSVRHGIMLNGNLDKDERVAFLESLPGWVWDARMAPERKAAIGQASKDRYWKNYVSFKTKRRDNCIRRWEQKIADASSEAEKATLRKRMNKIVRDSDVRTARRVSEQQT
tara:strand:- start:933 stop:1622 length:690 start_codon:yes stop_codon:yes gene_type:complete